MYNKFILGIIMFVFVFNQVAISKELEKDNKQLYLWEYKSQKSKVYILGSIHALKKDIYPLNSKIENAFNESNNLILEMISDSLSPLDMLTQINYDDGSELKDNISKENYKLIEKYAERYSLPASYYKNMKVWFLLMNFMMAELEKNGYSSEWGIESHFTAKAKLKSMPIHQLESPLVQLQYLKEFEKASDEYLTYSLENLEQSSLSLDTLSKAWINGKDEIVIDMIQGIEENYPEIKLINEKIINERNRNMANKIEQFLESENNYFIIVGSGHLIGKENIIEILNSKGIIFNRVSK